MMEGRTGGREGRTAWTGGAGKPDGRRTDGWGERAGREGRERTNKTWLPSSSRATVGQAPVGRVGQIIQSVSIGQTAIGLVGRGALSGQSGKLHNRASRANRPIGQSGKSRSRASRNPQGDSTIVMPGPLFASFMALACWKSSCQIACSARLGKPSFARLMSCQIAARLQLASRANRAIGRRLARLLLGSQWVVYAEF